MRLPRLFSSILKDRSVGSKPPSHHHHHVINPAIPSIGNHSSNKLSFSLKYKFIRLLNKKTIITIGVLILYSYVLLNTEYIYPELLNNTIKSITDEAEQVFNKKDPMAALQAAISDTIQSYPFQDYVQEYPLEDLRSRLSKKYQYDRQSSIPKNVWQTWSEPLERISNPNLIQYINSWKAADDYNYHLISDSEIESTIAELYVEFPEILDTLNKLPKDILKFDFLRYLLLFSKGGIYSDIDTTNLKPLTEWIDAPEMLPKYFDQPTNIGFIVGIEGDYDLEDWRYKMARRVQFCQWTFKSKVGHPILRELIYSIVDTTLNNYNERLNHVKIGSDYHTLHSLYTILNWTGPGAFTDIIFDHMNKIFKFAKIQNKNGYPSLKHTTFQYYHKERNEVNVENGKFVGWNNFTKISKPVMYDDVLVLPINSFNAVNDQMQIQPDDTLTFVKHDFKGSWKTM